MIPSIESVLAVVVNIVELVSAAILLIGFGKAAFAFAWTEGIVARKAGRPGRLAQLRVQLGTYILLGLDFYIVSDIIYSMIRPELNELINLALIVVLRTTIGFFLSREIAEIEHADERSVPEKIS